MTNFLEQLAAEWYEFQGYFVRRNIQVGPRANGGYECELDVVAFHPGKNHLVHIEPSMDAASWTKREKRYSLKFQAGRQFIPELFKGLPLPETIEQIALLVFASTKNHSHLENGRIVLISEFMNPIRAELSQKAVHSSAVPEQFTILRSLQFAANYWKQRVLRYPASALTTASGSCSMTVKRTRAERSGAHHRRLVEQAAGQINLALNVRKNFFQRGLDLAA